MFRKILYEFPIQQININFPKWVETLDDSHDLKQTLYSQIKDAFTSVSVLKQIDNCISKIQSTDIIDKTIVDEINLGNGNISISIILTQFASILPWMRNINFIYYIQKILVHIIIIENEVA